MVLKYKEFLAQSFVKSVFQAFVMASSIGSGVELFVFLDPGHNTVHRVYASIVSLGSNPDSLASLAMSEVA